jgi:RIO-like serine/threonine protein kinase
MKILWRKLRRFLGGASHRGALQSRINRLSLTPQGTVRKQAGPTFIRGEHQFDPRWLLQREAAFLWKLDGRCAPRLLASGDDWIEMEHCGSELSADNLPTEWREQLAEITAVLAETGIVHRDIKPGNLLVKDDRLYLIDFGWAIWADEAPYPNPRELCEDVPRELIYDNRAALDWLLSSYFK